MTQSQFHVYNYATIAEAIVDLYKNGKKLKTYKIEKPYFDSPRPCFGFIWSNFGNDVRTDPVYTIDYNTSIYINRNYLWAEKYCYKNYCALNDKEIDIYLNFVSKIAGDKFTITKKDFDDDSTTNLSFKGIIINLEAKGVLFKHMMVICNLIRYMYEWPEAYNIKQMMIAFQKDIFYSDFGQIFCLYESYMMNTYDQKVSYCNTGSTVPAFIPIKTTDELAQMLANMDIKKQASNFLEFSKFKNEMDGCTSKDCNNLWNTNKNNSYTSIAYTNKDNETLDDVITKDVSKLYRLIIMNDCVNQ